MDYSMPLLCVLGGILAAAGLIVSKKPDAKAMIDKLVPFQAFIGIALLAFGIINLLRWGPGMMVQLLKYWVIGGVALWGMVISGILLGILFGMPMLAKVSAGGAAKGEELGKKLAPFQTLIGLIALGSGLLGLLIQFGVLKPPGM
jgi:hypothetical protein